jgi:hypothetical protein
MSEGRDRTVAVRRGEPRGTRVIVLGGEHGWADAARLKQETRGVWPGATHVIVDLSAATFIDSSVVNWLLRVQATPARAFALSIVEGESASFVGRLFTTLGVHEVLACFPTREHVPYGARVERPARQDAAATVAGPLRARWVERAGPAHGLASAGTERGLAST